MFCPLMMNGLLSIGTTRANAESVKAVAKCIEDKCAWWIERDYSVGTSKEAGCAIKRLAEKEI